jgi:hypothetical protein
VSGHIAKRKNPNALPELAKLPQLEKKKLEHTNTTLTHWIEDQIAACVNVCMYSAGTPRHPCSLGKNFAEKRYPQILCTGFQEQ